MIYLDTCLCENQFVKSWVIQEHINKITNEIEIMKIHKYAIFFKIKIIEKSY